MFINQNYGGGCPGELGPQSRHTMVEIPPATWFIRGVDIQFLPSSRFPTSQAQPEDHWQGSLAMQLVGQPRGCRAKKKSEAIWGQQAQDWPRYPEIQKVPTGWFRVEFKILLRLRKKKWIFEARAGRGWSSWCPMVVLRKWLLCWGWPGGQRWGKNRQESDSHENTETEVSQTPVAHACNPRYSGGRDQENHMVQSQHR
jgi:hypothetical protein